jgi:hypothetical protein
MHLKLTDAKGNTKQSATGRIAVAAVPAGCHSFRMQVPTKTEPVLPYISSIATLTAIFKIETKKTRRKR